MDKVNLLRRGDLLPDAFSMKRILFFTRDINVNACIYTFNEYAFGSHGIHFSRLYNFFMTRRSAYIF